MIIRIPNIGGEKADVVEILVKPGDHITRDTSLIMLEGDKSTMDVPSPSAGVVQSIEVKLGDKVSEGNALLTLEGDDVAPTASAHTSQAAPLDNKQPNQIENTNQHSSVKSMAHAGPLVRRLAHELNVDLNSIKGTGEKQRITKEDILRFIKGNTASTHTIDVKPQIDFSMFGQITTEPLSKIKRISGLRLAQNWSTIPHVTQFEEVDITDLEDFRLSQKISFEKKGAKLTLIIFIMKALVATLKEFPRFNASLDASGENLILKSYYHIGVAVDTPNGLVVPVIRDVDTKNMMTLAQELSAQSQKAREKGLSVTDMQGGCFTISSLGGIGGTMFTPIVNAPEVAILGVSRSQIKPVYSEKMKQFEPRLILPLSLSYDHRVIDGADGARFWLH